MKYYAKVVRIRLEVACIEIESDDIKTGHEAADRALDAATADDLPWKMLPYDSEAYAPHVEMLVSDPELAEAGETAHVIRRWMRSPESSVQDRYLILHADLETGEGRTILQPWLSEAAGLTLADLCGEWMDDLADLSELAVDVPRPTNGSATIIPFPRPAPRPTENGGQSLT